MAVIAGKYSARLSRALPIFDSLVRPLTLVPDWRSRGTSPGSELAICFVFWFRTII